VAAQRLHCGSVTCGLTCKPTSFMRLPDLSSAKLKANPYPLLCTVASRGTGGADPVHVHAGVDRDALRRRRRNAERRTDRRCQTGEHQRSAVPESHVFSREPRRREVDGTRVPQKPLDRALSQIGTDRLSALFKRLPDLRLTRPSATLRWRRSLSIRGLQQLPVLC
jgi:hypothetical protein